MKLIEYLFDITETDSEDKINKADSDMWSYHDNIYLSYKVSNKISIDNYNSVISTVSGHRKDKEAVYVEFNALSFYYEIEIDDASDLRMAEPIMDNQLVCIRGKCDCNCSKVIMAYDSDFLRLIPSCEPVYSLAHHWLEYKYDCNLQIENLQMLTSKVGTSVFTIDWVDYIAMLFDVCQWIKLCKGLDVLIVNFDIHPTSRRPELSFESAFCAFHIQGIHIRVISEAAEIKKLYDEYKKYEAVDYSIEDKISNPRKNFDFKFERE